MLLGLLFALLELPHAWCMLLHKFLAPAVDHWCRRPEELAHWTQAEWRNFSSPAGDSCHIYNRSQGENLLYYKFTSYPFVATYFSFQSRKIDSCFD